MLLGSRAERFVEAFLRTYGVVTRQRVETVSLVEWLTARLALNPAYARDDDRSFEVETMLRLMEELDPETFRDITNRTPDGTLGPIHHVDGKLWFRDTPFDKLPSGWISIMKLFQEILGGYGGWTAFTGDKDLSQVDGIVLIDEIDAHVHPTWQARIRTCFDEGSPPGTRPGVPGDGYAGGRHDPPRPQRRPALPERQDKAALERPGQGRAGSRRDPPRLAGHVGRRVRVLGVPGRQRPHAGRPPPAEAALPIRRLCLANLLPTCDACNRRKLAFVPERLRERVVIEPCLREHRAHDHVFDKEHPFRVVAGDHRLVDPSFDDPVDHLALEPSVPEYQPRTPVGVVTYNRLFARRRETAVDLAKVKQAARVSIEGTCSDEGVEVFAQACGYPSLFRRFVAHWRAERDAGRLPPPAGPAPPVGSEPAGPQLRGRRASGIC